MGFRFNGVLPEIRTATALQQSEIVQQPFVIKTTDRRVNILDHVFVKAFRVGLQCLKEMKGLGVVFNFSCGQTEIKRQIVLSKIGKIWFHFFLLSALFSGNLGRKAAASKLLQSCPTLCDPIDGNPLGSSVPGILQARTLEWAAISFSNA